MAHHLFIKIVGLIKIAFLKKVTELKAPFLQANVYLSLTMFHSDL